MKKIILLIIVALVLVAGYLLLTTDNPQSATYSSEVYTFATADEQFTVQYDNDGSVAKLTYNDTVYELNSVRAASGAKYESSDGQVVFWEHQGEATLELNGEPVFANPAQQQCDDNLDQDCTGSDAAANEALDPDSDNDSLADTEQSDQAANEQLITQEWVWKGSAAPDSTPSVAPNDPAAFVLNVGADGRFSATTDCNNVMGSYVLDGSALQFTQIAATKKACLANDVQESIFTNLLADVTTFAVADQGQTTLTLGLTTGGTMTFVAVPSDVTLTHDVIIGMSEAEARSYAQTQGVPFRVVTRDGEALPVTLDYRPGRINAEVEGETVVAYQVEI